MSEATALAADPPAASAAPSSSGTESTPAGGRRLRIGIMLDSLQAPRWMQKVLRDITSTAGLDLVLVVVDADGDSPPARPRSWREWLRRQRAAFPHRLWEWYEAADYRRFRREGEDPFAPVDVAPDVGSTNVLRVSPLRTRFVDRFRPDDVERIRRAQLDVMIRFGFRIIKGEILATARYGVWSIHHGDNRVYRGGPPLFWEMFEGNPESGTMLQVLTDKLDGGRVIYRSTSATNFASVYKNRRETYWKTAEFIGRRLADLQRGGWSCIESLDTYHENDAYTRSIYRRPTNGQMVRFLARTAVHRARQKIVSKLDERWVVAVRRLDMPDSPYRLIEPPAGRFFADPCLAEHEGRTYLFFEDYRYAEQRGVISCVELADDFGARETGGTGEIRTVLECDCHLSYPFVFRWRDEWWMVPETAARRRVELYRARRFPYEWTFDRILLDHVDARDATLVEWQGTWWMFAATSVPGGPLADEVSLFLADSPLGPWRSHPGNPVVSDVRHARPAGAIFADADGLVRPAQDCRGGYGSAVTLNRIERMSEREYRERPIGSVLPTWRRGVRGTHTLSRTARFEAIDGRLLRWRPKRW